MAHVIDVGVLPGTDIDVSSLLGETVDGRYHVDELIGVGGSGATFRCTHVKTGGLSALKFFPPSAEGSQESLAEAKKVSRIKDFTYIVKVADIGDHPFRRPDGSPSTLPYLVSDYVEGQTLADFLAQAQNVPAKFVIQFAKQVCQAIAEFHAAGIEHGDLHSRNIMIVPPRPLQAKGELEFHIVKVVDFGMAKSFSSAQGQDTDMKRLGGLLHEIWLKTLSYEGRPMEAEKRFAGAIPELIKELNETDPGLRITDPQLLIRRVDAIFEMASRRPSNPITRLESPFEYISVEQIPDDSPLLSTLFATAPWFQEMREFGNVLLTGPRGCGKSMVLKNMRFRTWLDSGTPALKTLVENGYIGFYLHCHPTIYIPFTERYLPNDPNAADALLHYVNLLMAHEVISTIARATSRKVFETPPDVQGAFSSFVSGLMAAPPAVLQDADLFGTLSDLLDREARQVALRLRRGEPVEQRSGLGMYLDLARTIRLIPAIGSVRVYYLLDDYTDTNVPRPMQRSLNRLLRNRNDTYCFKISAEKFSVAMEDLTGNKIQTPHDLKVVDLGEKYLSEPSSKAQRDFIARIINERLSAAGKEITIQEILGRRSLAVKGLVALLADSKRHNEARYAGWETVYMLCSGDIRNVLELCRGVIETAIERGVDPYSGNAIPEELQHEVIREASREYLMAVKTGPRGDELFRVATVFGAISQKYLREHGPIGKARKGKGARYYEILRIDVDSVVGMTGSAQEIHEQLLRQAVFVEQGGAFREGATTRLIFRRIFAPNFQISYHNKESLRLNLARYENFLRRPEEFSKSGTDLLRDLSTPGITLERFSEEE